MHHPQVYEGRDDQTGRADFGQNHHQAVCFGHQQAQDAKYDENDGVNEGKRHWRSPYGLPPLSWSLAVRP